MKRPAVAGSQTQDTSGLNRQCSATTAGQPPTPTILYIYCTSGTKCLSRTPGSHSACAVRTLLGVDWKALSIRKEPMLSSFSHSKCSEHLASCWNLDVMRQKLRKVRSQTQDTSGLSRQCSATEPRQPDNPHNPLHLLHRRY